MKSTPEVSKTVWFLRALTDETNEQIAKGLSFDVSVSEERDVMCGDRKRRNLWKIEFSFLEQLYRSRRLGNFQTWRSENGRPPSNVTRVVASFFKPKLPKVISVGGKPLLAKRRKSKLENEDDGRPPWKE